MTIFVCSKTMDQKISSDKIKRYASAFNSAVLNNFFSKSERISGQEILTLSPVRQVNLFIVHSLMITWREESNRLRSPYFDFNHPEVTEAFTAFSNTLSKHISISRKDFEPLLEKATSDALLLILSPYDYYAEALDTGGQGKVSIPALQNLVRYLKINQNPLQKLVDRVGTKGATETISGREAFALLDLVLEEGFSPENPEIYLAEFATVRAVTLEDLLESPRIVPKKEPIVEKSETQFQKPAPPKKVPSSGPVQTSLYDELGKDARPTLADNFQKQKILKLKEHLTINQKFMFTKLLFNGDFDLFGQAIDRLDMMDTLLQAERFLDLNYSEWDKESEEYQDFRSLIERRFL